MTSEDVTPAGSWSGLRVLVLSPVPTWPVVLGNRNRIVQVNRALQREGAHLTLLHYPSDEDWRSRIPQSALAEMSRQWDALFHCPVTRPLHTRPSDGEDHAADDWWDPAIGQMLDWLFKVGRYDALLVNYTWLSKALDHAPRGVLRILDTHDRFSDRRALLAANGLGPEYFHTTQDQERIALDRADVVWAIKREEEDFFRTQTGREVRTVPHTEPLRPLPPPPVGDGVLRLGIVGGRNNINAANIRNFLRTADAYLRRTLLPVEIHLAGSVCTLLEDLRQPYLRLRGIVADIDDFYAETDVVLAPLAFSTGLKIKVGEALSRGKPIISHAHSFEGYAATHPFHGCADFEAMMRAIHRLVREPAEMAALTEASHRSLAEAEAEVLASLRHAGTLARQLPPSVVVSLRFDQVRPGSLVLDHALDVGRYAGFRAPVVFHLRGRPEDADAAALRLLAARGRMTVEPDALDGFASSAGSVIDGALPRAMHLADLLSEPHLLAWFAALPGDLPRGTLRTRVGACHLGALSLDPDPPAPAALAALAEAFPRFLLLEEAPTRLAAEVTGRTRAERIAVPMLWRAEESRLIAALRADRTGPVALLAEDAAAAYLVPILAYLTSTLGRGVRLFAAQGSAEAWPTEGPLAIRAELVGIAPLSAFFDAATWATGRPPYILEHGRPLGSLAAREVALRAGIPHLRLGDATAPDIVTTAPAPSYRARSFVSAALVIAALDRRAARPAAAAPTLPEEYARDAGWARIWAELGRLIAA